MDKILATIRSPKDLLALSDDELVQLAGEMREAMCGLLGTRSAHFASNLGVIELTLALHTTFDFSRDRLLWDTGHQVYPHKMVTGRYSAFSTIRTKGGLMGYPNPQESPYDLFMTGHAGCSVSCALGLKCGDDLLRPEEGRHVVAVIGDGAFQSGIVFEALSNAGGLKKNLTVVLNDNKMSICPRVGSLAEYLDRLRMTHFYAGLKTEIYRLLGHVPLIGDSMERLLNQIRDAVKAGLLGGMLFEELGFHYLGPVDGHNIKQLQKHLRMVREFDGPVLLHVVTEKGHGFEPAEEDPTSFHAPAPFYRKNGSQITFKERPAVSYTQVARDAILAAMENDQRVVAITAAMCQGNMLEPVRDRFAERFFDVGICESLAVAFAAGLAKAGLRPIVDIYSTFLQRSYDQIFQELSLQSLPVLLMLDRAGLTGPDGPTHHGVFDLGYLRVFPHMVVMAPGDAADLSLMVPFALSQACPCAIRYPKARAEQVRPHPEPVELGKAEWIRHGEAGTIIACGPLLSPCVAAADQLAGQGMDVGVINARFVKPLDTGTILEAIQGSPFVLTVEEGTLAAGFGSAVVEAAVDAGVDVRRLRRLGIPDHYVEHGGRGELLADLGLDAAGIARRCVQLAGLQHARRPAPVRRAR
ncbi:MAG TPA: 1-deoxy-D-xylulose-5-phosphate synthase [Planctomycetes bacterium]|nr:1-deoxy-D-xylulose-5-phosphate synthase [Planctomycetota bacterium]